MPHRRDEIRKILVDALMDKTFVKENVYNWRIRPVQNEKNLPCISVYIPDETVLEISGAQDLIHRNAQVYILIYNSISHHEDNISDEVSRQIEGIVNVLDSKDFNFKYNKTELFTENLSTKLLILTSLHYECSYFTKEFKKIDADNFEQLSIEVPHG